MIVVSAAFLSFLLTFLYAVFRWSVADARSRGKSAWPLATLLVGVPVLAYLARIAFRSFVPRSLSSSIMLGVPLLAWVVWLVVRPAVQQKPTDAILCGRAGAASRWILILALVAAVYGMTTAWLAQLVMYPLYLAVPPGSFPAYFEQYNYAIVFPVIVALSLGWVLSAVLTWYRPPAVPAWAAWASVGLALLGFLASAAFEFPYNQQLMEHGYNAEAIRAKIVGNWYRVVPWTLQAGLLAWMTSLALSATGPKRETPL
ncbi:MAG: hypothetical protein HY013_18150 [Candidatus Solibacter usitatus]|nr:hypothetical protein [Candidatus Solibacter usitatus]